MHLRHLPTKGDEDDDEDDEDKKSQGCCLPTSRCRTTAAAVALSGLMQDRKRKSALLAEAEREAAKVIDRQDNIRQQQSDPFSYRYLELENGIRILLVSKGSAGKAGGSSAVALDLKVGSFSDPANLQGLAHLCEHVLFTGSEAYPNESYSAFLGDRGGSSNAFTSSEHTNFHFDVSPQHLEEALARFVSFFQGPLFKEASVQNELEIVQGEHEKNRWNDAWRTNQVERATANEAHAFSRFSTGNRQTLSVEVGDGNRNLKYELFSFFRTNYSANLMTACMVHDLTLDRMEHLAKEYFLRIPNKNVPETIWPSRPFKAAQLRSKVFVVPVRDIFHVNLTFPVEDLREFYQSAPEGCVAQLVGHKGPGGLLAHLRHLGLAHHLVAAGKNLARGLAFFVVTVHMTEAGERHVDEIVRHVFQYLNLLKKEGGVPIWFLDELRLLSEQQFEHKEPERSAQSYASNVAGWLHMYPPRDVLTGDYVITSFRPDVVRRVLRRLEPDNVRVTVVSKNCRYFASQVEPHFGTEYHVERLSEETLSSWRQCGTNPHHRLPQPNHLIDLAPLIVLVDPERHGPRALPELFLSLERVRMRAWFRPATHFGLAKAFVFVKFFCPALAARDAVGCCMNNLLALLVQDALAESAYCAELAGLFYGLRATKWGLELTVRGYSAKQSDFLRTVLAALYSATFCRDGFDRVMEAHRKGLESSSADSLKAQSKLLLCSILCPTTFSPQQRLEALKEVHFQDWLDHADAFRARCSLECFFYGNLTLAQADQMSSAITEERRTFLEALVESKGVAVPEQIAHLEEWFLKNPVERIVVMEEALKDVFEKQPLSDGVVVEVDKDSNALFHSQEMRLPAKSDNVFIVGNEVQSSSCVLFYLQFLTCSPANAALLEVFFHLVRVRLITTMKHVVTLGYVVGCDVRRVNNTLGFRIVVESQYPLRVVHETIERALEEVGSFLVEELSPETLEMSKQALTAAREETALRMRDCAAGLWREILDGTYHFRRLEDELSALRSITAEQVRGFYRDWIRRGGEERRKLVISIGPDPILNCLGEKEEGEQQGLDRVPELRGRCGSFPELSPDDLAAWFTAVFQSETNDYAPPPALP